ncbi:MAG: PRC-barrel domain-containing protein [Luteolibacter sp.]
MKRKLELLGGTYAAALMLTTAALAVEPATDNPTVEDNAASSAPITSNFGRTSKASLLMGKNVKNLQGETLGDINDIIVDLAAGRIVAVVISSGGFLGMGNELSIVPPGALHFSAGGDALLLDVSKETLSQAPHFKSSEWPDLSKAGYVSSVYSAYKQAPYTNQYVPSQADNTARNTRDRDANKPTPLDQGNSQSDLEITAKIRKDIMAQPDISMNAQNVKIITTNGHVTLRGPVESAEEKRLVCDLAIKATHKDSVDDQLEVK